MSNIDDLHVDGKLLPLHVLLDFLEGNDEAIPQTGVEIAILPPNNATDDVTDEDSGDEEIFDIDNVPPSQINAPALMSGLSIPIPDDIQSRSRTPSPTRPSPSAQSPIPSKRRKIKTTRQKKKPTTSYKWKCEDLPRRESEWQSLSTVQNELKSPLEYFKLFFDEDVINMMVTFTNQYAAKKNLLGDISENEMSSFIAILLLSGYISVSRKEMFWETSSDTHNSLVAEAISRDRFKYIMSNLHVCNNDELDPEDRFGKVRPLLTAIRERCLDFSPHEEHHSVDESMVPYFGRHGTKQFIRGKPIRYGYKFWCGSTSSGYLTWFEPYQGIGTLPEKYSSYGLGYGVVMTYADSLLSQVPYHLYFDNFFTSLQLVEDLKKRNINCTGTIRINRVGKDCRLEKPEIMKKKERGSYDYQCEKSKSILLVTWNDNSVVTVASNFDTLFPTHQVNRYSQAKKKKISVPQPHLIRNYNTYMGGIDRIDQNISLYRVSIRGKKWYFPIIAHIIDIGENNAWQLYKRDGGKLDHLAFRRRICTAILETNKRITTSRGRPSSSSKIDSRYDKMEHYVSDLPTETSGKKKTT